jgi:hypothetical protein
LLRHKVNRGRVHRRGVTHACDETYVATLRTKDNCRTRQSGELLRSRLSALLRDESISVSQYSLRRLHLGT